MIKKWLSLLMIFTLCISANAQNLIPGGESAGVNLRYDGVLVTGTYAFFDQEKEIQLNKGKFKEGDLIYQCYDTKIEETSDLIYAIQNCMNENKDILVNVKNGEGDQKVELDVYFDRESDTFKTGLYITDHMTAIGTITYYNPTNHTFGAFGHSIDVDNNCLNFSACYLFDAYITSIDRNTKTATGKKIGTIEKTKRIGNITLNHHLGIFGTYDTIYKDDQTTLETGSPNLGEALIYTTLDDNKTNAYKIYIDKIDMFTDKNISFHVVDEKLIQKTNGIIPGMSGSPIIQDGKIIGAVTHVLVNDPTKGYGIFIENMLNASS